MILGNEHIGMRVRAGVGGIEVGVYAGRDHDGFDLVKVAGFGCVPVRYFAGSLELAEPASHVAQGEFSADGRAFRGVMRMAVGDWDGMGELLATYGARAPEEVGLAMAGLAALHQWPSPRERFEVFRTALETRAWNLPRLTAVCDLTRDGILLILEAEGERLTQAPEMAQIDWDDVDGWIDRRIRLLAGAVGMKRLMGVTPPPLTL